MNDHIGIATSTFYLKENSDGTATSTFYVKGKGKSDGITTSKFDLKGKRNKMRWPLLNIFVK